MKIPEGIGGFVRGLSKERQYSRYSIGMLGLPCESTVPISDINVELTASEGHPLYIKAYFIRKEGHPIPVGISYEQIEAAGIKILTKGTMGPDDGLSLRLALPEMPTGPFFYFHQGIGVVEGIYLGDGSEMSLGAEYGSLITPESQTMWRPKDSETPSEEYLERATKGFGKVLEVIVNSLETRLFDQPTTLQLHAPTRLFGNKQR